MLALLTAIDLMVPDMRPTMVAFSRLYVSDKNMLVVPD